MNDKLKPRPPWSKLEVKPANPIVECVGETLERVHCTLVDDIHIYVGCKTIVLCFGNGKSIHLDAELHTCRNGCFPVIRSRDGDWEMIKAVPEGLPISNECPEMPEVKPPREPGEADLHEIDGANQD